MSTDGNGGRVREAGDAGAALYVEDIHDHPVTLASEGEQGATAESFNCHSRRWAREGADGRGGLTVLLIPGIGHNVNFFGPLAARLLAPSRGVEAISQVVALDLPAHGGSETPPGVRFGRLTLGNYVDAIFQVVSDLRERGSLERVDILCGHSMGGTLAMMTAQSCLERGSALTDEWGTRGVVMLASALPQGVPWSLVEGVFDAGPVGPVLLKLAPFLTKNLRYGLFVAASPEDYLLQFYAVDGRLVETAPTIIEAVSLNGFESFAAACELCGLDLETGKPLTRPEVDEGIFRTYALGVASYEQDALFKPSEERALGVHLFGGEDGWTYHAVRGPQAVHCMPYSVPDASCDIFAAVAAALAARREE